MFLCLPVCFSSHLPHLSPSPLCYAVGPCFVPTILTLADFFLWGFREADHCTSVGDGGDGGFLLGASRREIITRSHQPGSPRSSRSNRRAAWECVQLLRQRIDLRSLIAQSPSPKGTAGLVHALSLRRSLESACYRCANKRSSVGESPFTKRPLSRQHFRFTCHSPCITTLCLPSKFGTHLFRSKSTQDQVKTKVSPGNPQVALVSYHHQGHPVLHHERGFHQCLTPSVPSYFRMSLSTSLHVGVDFCNSLPSSTTAFLI